MTSQPSYARTLFERQRQAIEGEQPVAGRVLEIGPGANLAASALFVQAGANSAVCIDQHPWVADNLGTLYDHLGVLQLMDRVSYVHAPVETMPFPAETFDIVFSHATFEHFRDPLAATLSIARVLRPGGITTHLIDLRDHRDSSRPLDFLKYDHRLWNWMTSRRLLSTNRWRASDLRRAFGLSGLEIRRLQVTARAEVTRDTATSFAPPFRSKTLEDLSAVEILLVAVKPTRPHF
jgi:SAM-dependent methyltransferase